MAEPAHNARKKLTRNQERILHYLQTLDRAQSAQDIYTELRDRHQSIGLATVYRALEALKLRGTIQALTLPTGEAVYSIVRADRHHLNCLNCGASLPIDCCPLQNLSAELHRQYNFTIFYHTLEFFGLCRTCQPPQPEDNSPPA